MVTSPPVDLQESLADLVCRIRSVVEPIRIILFGSHARGDARVDSDLDIMVIVPEGTHRRHTRQSLYMKMRGLGMPVDFVVATESDLERFGNCSASVIEPALREGVVIDAA